MVRLETKGKIAVALLSAGVALGCTSSPVGDRVPPAFASSSERPGSSGTAKPSSTASENMGSGTPTTPSPSPTESETMGNGSASVGASSKPPTEVFSGDPSIKRGLQQAPRGERITLEDPLIGSITRVPTVGGENYVATIWVQTRQGDNDVAAFVPQSMCLFNALQAHNELGNPSFIPGRWRVATRIDALTADVTTPYSLLTPKPTIHLDSVTVSGNRVQC